MQKSAIATTGLVFFSSSITNAMSTSCPYDGYNPYAEEITDLRSALFSKHVQVKGILYDKDGINPLKDATVEVWHLSPYSKKYRHRAKLVTNEAGEYNFITDFPNREEGQGCRIYFKINASGKTQFTELVLTGTDAFITAKHWEQHSGLGEKMFPKMKNSFGTSTVNFNLSISE
jgi:hypothetical protein